MDRIRWWLKVRAAKRWAKQEERRVLVERYQKAMSRKGIYTQQERIEAMNRGVFL